jgi:WD40 repeat protein
VPESESGSFVAPELVIQTGHTSAINSVKFSKSGTLLLTASDDGMIKLWDVRSGTLLRTFVGHRGVVTSIAFAANDAFALSGSDANKYSDQTTKLWNLTTGEVIREFGECRREDADCKMEPRPYSFGDEYYLSQAPDLDKVELRNMSKGELIYTFDGSMISYASPSLSKDGKKIWAFGSCQGGDCFKRWDIASRELEIETVLEGEAPEVAPDGYSAVVIGETSAVLMNLQTGKAVKRFAYGDGKYPRFYYSPDGCFVSVDLEKEIKILDARSGEELHSVVPPPDTWRRVTFDASGRAVIDGPTLEYWDLRARKLIFSRSTDSPKTSTKFYPVLIRFGPDGKTITVWGVEATRNKQEVERRPRLEVLDPQTGKTLWRNELSLSLGAETYGGGVPLDYAPDGRLIAVGASDGSVHLLSAEDGATSWRSGGGVRPFAPVFTKDGGKFALERSTDLKIWERASGDLVDDIDLSRLSPRRQERIIFDKLGIRVKRYSSKPRKKRNVRPPVLTLAIPAAGAPTVKRQTRAAKMQRDPSVRFELFSPDGKFMVRSSGGSTVGGIEIEAVPSGEDVKSAWSGTSQPEAAFSPDSRWLAYDTGAGVIGLINLLKPASAEVRMEGHSAGSVITNISFSPDSKLMASAATDSTVRLWAIPEGRLVATVISTSDAWLVVTPNGLFDGSPDGMRLVSWRYGRGTEVVPLESFYNDFFHPGLLGQLLSGAEPQPLVDLATMLQLPGLRAMLASGLAKPRPDGKPGLCLPTNPTAVSSACLGVPLDFNKDDPECPYVLTLPGVRQSADVPAAAPARARDGEESEVGRATLHVQVIGVGDYGKAVGGFSPLRGIVPGAKRIEGFFDSQRLATNSPFKKVRAWDGLYDERATRRGILDRLGEIERQAGEEDVLFLFLSGHGVVPAGQEMFYFAPSDARPEAVRETGISTAVLADALRRMRARRIVLFIDSCQSGGAIESLAKIASVKVQAAEARERAARDSRARRMQAGVGMYLVAAATPLEEAVQSNTGSSALASTLLEALSTRPETKATLPARDVVSSIRARLPQVSDDLGKRQHPVIVSAGVDFPLAAFGVSAARPEATSKGGKSRPSRR